MSTVHAEKMESNASLHPILLPLMLVAAGHLLWLVPAWMNESGGFRLLTEVLIVACLGLASQRLVLGLAGLVVVRAVYYLTLDIEGSIYDLPDAMHIVGLGGLLVAFWRGLGGTALAVAATIAAIGAVAWLPFQNATGHYEWTPGTLLQTAGWALLAWRIRTLSGSDARPSN